MKFVVSSSELLGHLQSISRVISSKNTLPILDNFLFNLSGNDLEITASDLESTLITRMKLENTDGDGTIALPARILLDTLKEFSVQPLTFDINMDTMAVVISSENGKFNVVGQNGIDFPALPSIKKDKNAFFVLSNYNVVCRLVEGNYPNYNSVIPKNNPRKITIDRVEFFNTLKRVSVFSNQASNLVKLQLKGNQVLVSAQDIDFSISAYERIKCQYEGDEIEIGFKSVFLVEILSNIGSQDVMIELADPTRAGLFLPVISDNESEDLLMLLMPMMINA